MMCFVRPNVKGQNEPNCSHIYTPFQLSVFVIKILFIHFFGLDSSGLDNDNAESGIGTATPPKEQVCHFFLSLFNLLVL